jgi:hypothetical protein
MDVMGLTCQKGNQVVRSQRHGPCLAPFLERKYGSHFSLFARKKECDGMPHRVFKLWLSTCAKPRQ